MLQRDVGPDLKTAGGASRRDAATGKAVPMIDERIAVSALRNATDDRINSSTAIRKNHCRRSRSTIDSPLLR